MATLADYMAAHPGLDFGQAAAEFRNQQMLDPSFGPGNPIYDGMIQSGQTPGAIQAYIDNLKTHTAAQIGNYNSGLSQTAVMGSGNSANPYTQAQYQANPAALVTSTNAAPVDGMLGTHQSDAATVAKTLGTAPYANPQNTWSDAGQGWAGWGKSTMDQAQNDWNTWFQTSQKGIPTPWHGGQIVNNGDGTATITDPQGKTFTYKQADGPAALAGLNTFFGNNFGTDYGQTGSGNPAAQAATAAPAATPVGTTPAAPATQAASTNTAPSGAPLRTPNGWQSPSNQFGWSTDQTARMTSDWNNFFSGAAGTEQPWNGGSIMNNGNGTATIKNPDGVSYTFNQADGPNKLAQSNPFYGSNFGSFYGVGTMPVQAAEVGRSTIGSMNSPGSVAPIMTTYNAGDNSTMYGTPTQQVTPNSLASGFSQINGTFPTTSIFNQVR